MTNRSSSLVLIFFGCLACLAVPSTVNADGRLFVLNLENSTGLMGFTEAERACASLHARLASSAELRHAVVECFFAACTRGWLHGGTVGTTVCSAAGSALKAVDVKTENATEDGARLNAFCIKDSGVPCGDPPSFPNARLQGHSGYEMGDELLYTCVPGYIMPSGHKAFSLLCDSCGEWYGMVEICVKDETEGHVDYEDKFSDTYGGSEDRERRAEEARVEAQEEVHGAAREDGEPSQRHQETTFSSEQRDVGAGGGEEAERAAGDFVGHPVSEREPGATADAATEAPVSLLSQKHMFWFPSEAFQDEVTQRDSGVQSEESREKESQEVNNSQKPINPDDPDHESDRYAYHDADDHDDHNDDVDDEGDTHDYGDHGDRRKPYTPDQHEDLEGLNDPGNQDNRDDHYDMGEHEEDHGRIRYDDREYDGRDDTYDEQESYEDHEDPTEDRGDDEQEHLDVSQEHPDHDDSDDREGDEDHYNQKEDDDDHYATTDDHDDHNDDHEAPDDDDDDGDLDDDHDDEHVDHDDHDDHTDDRDGGDQEHVDLSDDDDHDDHPVDRADEDDREPDNDDLDDRGGHKDDDRNSYEDRDSQEEAKDGDYHVIFSITRDHHRNRTEMGDGGKATTDETWLDGYPVVAAETENADSLAETTEDEDTGVVNEVEGQKPVSHTSLPGESQLPSKEPALQQEGGQGAWPGFIPTATPTSDSNREQAAPTHSWMDDLTQQSFINRDPARPVPDGNAVTEEHAMRDLPGEVGERGEMEGEMGETVCTGEGCPPPASTGQSPKVAAIVVVVCLVAIAAMVGVWCYRRQQQKSSVYEMNGKGQGQSRPAQQMEMQQKV